MVKEVLCTHRRRYYYPVTKCKLSPIQELADPTRMPLRCMLQTSSAPRPQRWRHASLVPRLPLNCGRSQTLTESGSAKLVWERGASTWTGSLSTGHTDPMIVDPNLHEFSCLNICSCSGSLASQAQPTPAWIAFSIMHGDHCAWCPQESWAELDYLQVDHQIQKLIHMCFWNQVEGQKWNRTITFAPPPPHTHTPHTHTTTLLNNVSAQGYDGAYSHHWTEHVTSHRGSNVSY